MSKKENIELRPISFDQIYTVSSSHNSSLQYKAVFRNSAPKKGQGCFKVLIFFFGMTRFKSVKFGQSLSKFSEPPPPQKKETSHLK